MHYITFSVTYGSMRLFLQIGGRVLWSGLPITEEDSKIGITVIPVASKAMGKVLTRIISNGVDVKLEKKQAWFRQERSMIQQMFILRNIVEQGVELNSCLYIDYES